jgi:hypothetical protein
MKNGYDIVYEAEWHNSQPWIQDIIMSRNQYLSNIPDYETGNNTHHLATIQVTSKEHWKQLDLTLSYTPLWLENLLTHLETPGCSAQFGELRVSLLRQRNETTGQHDAISLVYSIPHFECLDGIISCMKYTDGSTRHQILTDMFDLSKNCWIAELNEFQILSYLANEADARHLLFKYFKPGFNSLPFDEYVPKMSLQFDFGPESDDDDYDFVEHEESQEEHESAVKIPPPPKMDGFDLTDLYFKELAKIPEENEAFFPEGNVTQTPLVKAREAAKLKREKKAAALASRKEGKSKAEEERQQIANEKLKNASTKQEQLEEKISKARKAMGVRKNEPNPPGLDSLIEKWRYEIFYQHQ